MALFLRTVTILTAQHRQYTLLNYKSPVPSYWVGRLQRISKKLCFHRLSADMQFSKATLDFLYDGLSTAAQESMQDTAIKSQRIRSPKDWLSDINVRHLFQSFSKTKALLAVFWIWLLSWGEKRSFETHISRCKWENWEKWVSGTYILPSSIAILTPMPRILPRIPII